jgi:lysophospholipase
MMTPAELCELRTSLPAFAEDQACGLLRQYLASYHLDFSEFSTQSRYSFGLVPSGSYQLMTQRWLLPDARANLLLVHGYFDHAGLYDKLVAYGLSRRCNVLIFDLPGHGLSSGEPGVIDDFADYGRAVKDVLQAARLPDLPLHTIGQSTGCAALMEFARHYSWPFQRTVLLAPLVRPAAWLAVRTGHVLLHRFSNSVVRKFSRNSSDPEFLDFIRRDPLQNHRVSLRWIGALRRWLAGLPLADLGVGPALVIQGQQDGTVDWRYNMDAISKLFPDSVIHYLPAAGHQLANESAQIRASYSEVADRYLFG